MVWRGHRRPIRGEHEGGPNSSNDVPIDAAARSGEHEGEPNSSKDVPIDAAAGQRPWIVSTAAVLCTVGNAFTGFLFGGNLLSVPFFGSAIASTYLLSAPNSASAGNAQFYLKLMSAVKVAGAANCLLLSFLFSPLQTGPFPPPPPTMPVIDQVGTLMMVPVVQGIAWILTSFSTIVTGALVTLAALDFFVAKTLGSGKPCA
jgi:hypothetical protein